jgi:hypothetical protein
MKNITNYSCFRLGNEIPAEPKLMLLQHSAASLVEIEPDWPGNLMVSQFAYPRSEPEPDSYRT